jgi:hypothetical protein
MFACCHRLYRSADVPDPLAAGGLDRVEANLRRHAMLIRWHLRHREDQDAVAVRGVRQHPIDRLKEADQAVIRTDRPFGHHEITLVLVRPSLLTMDRDCIVGDEDRNVAGLKARHGRHEHDPMGRLIHAYRERLRGSHEAALSVGVTITIMDLPMRSEDIRVESPYPHASFCSPFSALDDFS